MLQSETPLWQKLLHGFWLACIGFSLRFTDAQRSKPGAVSDRRSHQRVCVANKGSQEREGIGRFELWASAKPTTTKLGQCLVCSSERVASTDKGGRLFASRHFLPRSRTALTAPANALHESAGTPTCVGKRHRQQSRKRGKRSSHKDLNTFLQGHTLVLV